MIRTRPVCRLPVDAERLHGPLNVLENEFALILQC